MLLRDMTTRTRLAFQNTRIGTRIAIGLGIVVALLLSVAGVAYWGSREVSRVTRTDLALAKQIEEKAALSRGESRTLQRWEKDYLLHVRDPAARAESLTKWQASHPRLEGWLAELEPLVDDATRASVVQMRQDLRDYVAGLDRVRAAVDAGTLASPEAANEALAASQARILRLESAIMAVTEAAVKRGEQVRASFVLLQDRVQGWLLAATLLAFGLAALVSVVLARGIRRPLERAVAGARAVAQGRFEITAAEELGQVQQAFEGVRDQLVETRLLMAQVEDDNRALQNSITELLTVVAMASDGDLTVRAPVSAGVLGNVSDAFNSLLESLQELLAQVGGQIDRTESFVRAVREASDRMSNGADLQFREILGATKLVEQMSEEIGRVSSGAGIAVEATRRTEESARGGSKAVEEVITGMGALRANVQAGAKKMKTLGDRSMEITGIVATISRISEQTNMLALNAAIEAARAGEHGRGFTVVADEVRKLAERAASATRDIDRLVKAIHAETNETAAAIEQQTHVVEQEAEAVGEAGQSLKKIQDASTQSTAVVIDISAIASDQFQRTGSVVKAMERISTIARDTQSGAAGTASTVQELARMSQQLQQSVGRFKLT